MNESELSIAALMTLMKQDADEIVSKGEKIIGKGVTFIEEAPEQKPVKDEDEDQGWKTNIRRGNRHHDAGGAVSPNTR